jgi:ribose 5-phosphate isomerase B
MAIAIGSDHGGVHLKDEIKRYFAEKGIEFFDFGAQVGESVDYPDVAKKLAVAVADGTYERGILVCGTGIGVSISANKVQGIRAALCTDVYSAQMAREHNDANILTLGERVTGPGLALMIVETWLNTAFAGGRHARRVNKIMEIEQNH